jgi:predicted MFS family arabinose efflux permease
LGSFLGVWLGGYLFDASGSYNGVWWAAAAIALVTAVIHIFIDERPVVRLRVQLA